MRKMEDEEKEWEERLKKLDAALDEIMECCDRVKRKYNFTDDEMNDIIEMVRDQY
jgi:sugar-specific transcriptional regulator TrmB